jgi:carboxyl-terminal processing protease
LTPPARRALLIGLIVGVLAGLWLGARSDRIEPLGDLLGDEQTLSDEALEVIGDSYFRGIDTSRLEDASVRAMIQDLRGRYGDRFSHYFNARQLERFEQSTSGRFSGIGLSVLEVKRGLRVASVFDGTPAAEAGIAEGDVIVGVDGRSIAGEPANAATARIKGPPGSEVELRIQSAGGGRTREISLQRAEVRVPAVQGDIRRAGPEKVAYVRLAGFSEGAHGELRNEIERLYQRGAQGIVLDLRGNGGGLLNEAVLTSSVFIEDGVIVSTSGRTQPQTDYEAVGGALDPQPMVVLIDRNTASAAEILAAALSERGLATLVGTRTFGKGTFQEVIELDHGGALDLTVGEYLTSDGESLAGKGIRPGVRASDRRGTPSDEGLRRGLDVLGRELAAEQ